MMGFSVRMRNVSGRGTMKPIMEHRKQNGLKKSVLAISNSGSGWASVRPPLYEVGVSLPLNKIGKLWPVADAIFVHLQKMER